MIRLLAVAILMSSVAGFAFAGKIAPEIDASSGAAALGLIAGGMLILRSRRKKS
jgi:MYXO-CTERM domain-containing protein